MIEQALKMLSEGQIIGMPTESVYGLAADATNDTAVARIYAVKKRPSINPLIIHVDSIEMARQWGVFTELAEMLAKEFWYKTPSSLTLIVKRNNAALSHLVTAGLDTVAIRMPMHAIALDLINKFGKPLSAPSANKSNSISPTSAEAVAIELGELIPLIIDGGPCRVGVESTILDVSENDPILLRPGGTTLEAIEKVLGITVKTYTENTPTSNTKSFKAPGMMKRHYAPSIPLRLNAKMALPGEAYLTFGTENQRQNETLNLSESGDLVEATANLFRMIRLLDCSSYNGIAVAPIPNFGLGLAINDRLSRASAE
ncbi:MAG: L-threonylcarbamoyladenylate synthase [Candidatus Paracaedibacteraceae bacterium]|nr:L-threonylcarbamoyladenylate synthase [Candidatus Paracaedibacteraceae bacterium]